ncbi:MAG TPA: 2Fe-2S iron-sulfur cluster-binding protein [Pseudobdellovibrionaceae bacterium]|nr:2Fe-2S iron-sulfur cluster-binding protein [Pseudobdellovibrionaceae bacterium]
MVNNRDISASQNESILEACSRQGFQIEYSCEGGTCGACRVIVEKNSALLPPRNEIEAETALDRGFADSERLACQTTPVEGAVLRTPDFKG